jgi:hypothetical protein
MKAFTNSGPLKLGDMLDITSPTDVEIKIRADRKVVWINVEGSCVFRACRIGCLTPDIPDDILYEWWSEEPKGVDRAIQPAPVPPGITVRYIRSFNEVRLYKDNGSYWPIIMKGYFDHEIGSLEAFLSETDVKCTIRDEFSDGSPVPADPYSGDVVEPDDVEQDSV